MENERFALDSGRKRPKYTPKDIHCPSCGAGLTVKDERSELVVCEYCGSHLNVSKEEKEVLGKGASRKWEFPLQIGESFRHKRIRYEIIARMAFIEDGDEDELSRDYLLYNPYHGSMWLSEYDGSYSLSTDTHVMPKANPFSLKRGDVMATHDDQEWVLEGTGVYELVYVDGALPWIAKIGDRIEYAEFLNKPNSKLQYEAQRIEGEIEYGKGESLSVAQLRRALAKPEFEKGEEAAPAGRGVKNVVQTRRNFMLAFALVIIMFAVNAVTFLYASSQGKLAMQQTFSAKDLTEETYSKPFKVVKGGDVLRIAVNASVDNAWMALDLGIVKDDATLIHVDDADVSYYHGYEGGESWSEGSRKKNLYIKIPWEGDYKLMVHAVSAGGNTETATQASHSATVMVYSGAMKPTYSMLMAIASIVMLVMTFIGYKSWQSEEE
jgi:ribosomal protein S27E